MEQQATDPTAVLLAKVYALILSWPLPDEVDELPTDKPKDKGEKRPFVTETAVGKQGEQDEP
ncbi:MAG: hypothetical protein H6653_20285 [Ardenticatenaceae bacterium]|nr:hypothetical protein [Ardenticatenaceae bacterium]